MAHPHDADGRSAILRLAERQAWLVGIIVSLLALWLILVLLTYQGLPERIPMHFVPDGTPTRVDPTTLWRWMLLPGIAIALLLAMPLLERATLAINRPYGVGPREPEARRAWKGLRRTYLDLLGTAMIVALGVLHLGVWTVAAGRAGSIPLPFIVLPFAAFLLALLLIIPFHRASHTLERGADSGPGRRAVSG